MRTNKQLIEENTEIPEEMKQKLAEIVAGIVADNLLKQKAEFKKLVEGMKREEGQDIITATDIRLESFKEGYNQALTDIIKKVDEMYENSNNQ